MNKLFTLLFSFLLIGNAYCQDPVAYVLITVSEKSEVKMDDGSVKIIYKNEPFKIKSMPGEHLITAKSLESEATFTSVIILENGKQKVLNVNYATKDESIETKEIPIIDVANIDITIPGIAKIAASQGTYKSNDYDDYPTYYFGLEKSDQIIFSVEPRNKTGKNEIRIVQYETDSIIYFNDGFQSINNLNIKIPERGVYYFQFRSKNALDRKASFVLKRKPATLLAVKFNTDIEWKMVSDTVKITSEVDGKEMTEQKINFVEKAILKEYE